VQDAEKQASATVAKATNEAQKLEKLAENEAAKAAKL
jgi:hypothetical protein